MKFQYAEIPDNPTKSDIKKAIEELKQLKIDFKNKNEALKIILNSIYGVAGFINFICYNRDVAESITLQSQDLIQFTIKIFNDYFKDMWYDDTELHDKMGITKIQKIKFDVINYADTDSVFALLGKIQETTDFKGDITDFILSLNENRLHGYIKKKMVEYVDKFNGFQQKINKDAALKLDMEQICKSILWISKKHYIKNPVYFDNMRYESLSKIQIKGWAANQSSVPKFVRGKLKEIAEFIIGCGAKIDRTELLNRLRAVKTEFTTAPLQYICKIERVSDYEKWILNDTTNLEYMDGAKPHVKGAGCHNYLLKRSDFKDKYEMIRSGAKVHWYYSKSGMTEAFGFLTGNLPEEIAPPPNVNKQFEKVFLAPINSIFKAINMAQLNASLIIYPTFDRGAIKD